MAPIYSSLEDELRQLLEYAPESCDWFVDLTPRQCSLLGVIEDVIDYLENNPNVTPSDIDDYMWDCFFARDDAVIIQEDEFKRRLEAGTVNEFEAIQIADGYVIG